MYHFSNQNTTIFCCFYYTVHNNFCKLYLTQKSIYTKNKIKEAACFLTASSLISLNDAPFGAGQSSRNSATLKQYFAAIRLIHSRTRCKQGDAHNHKQGNTHHVSFCFLLFPVLRNSIF